MLALAHGESRERREKWAFGCSNGSGSLHSQRSLQNRRESEIRPYQGLVKLFCIIALGMRFSAIKEAMGSQAGLKFEPLAVFESSNSFSKASILRFANFLVLRQFVALKRLPFRYLLQNSSECLSVRSGRPFLYVVLSEQRRDLLRHSCGDQLIDRNTFSFGNLLDVPMNRIRQTQTQCTHDNRFSSCCGVQTSIPRSSSPRKWRTLWVTIGMPPAATASSTRWSSFASVNRGRQR